MGDRRARRRTEPVASPADAHCDRGQRSHYVDSGRSDALGSRVSGVSGGDKYASQQQKWRAELATFLTTSFALPDGNLYLDPEPRSESVDVAIAALQRQRLALERHLDELKARKPSMPETAYQAEFETILVQLAKIAQQIRQQS